MSRKNAAFRSRRYLESGYLESRRYLERDGEDSNRLILKFWRDETGATAIEDGLIATGISLAIVSVINGLGSRLSSKFVSVNSSLQ